MNVKIRLLLLLLLFSVFIDFSESFLSLSLIPEPGACRADTMAEECSEDGVWGFKKIPNFLSLTSWGRGIPGQYLRESTKKKIQPKTLNINFQPMSCLSHPKNEEYPHLSTIVGSQLVTITCMKSSPAPLFLFPFSIFSNKFEIIQLEIPSNRVKKKRVGITFSCILPENSPPFYFFYIFIFFYRSPYFIFN